MSEPAVAIEIKLDDAATPAIGRITAAMQKLADQNQVVELTTGKVARAQSQLAAQNNPLLRDDTRANLARIAAANGDVAKSFLKYAESALAANDNAADLSKQSVGLTTFLREGTVATGDSGVALLRHGRILAGAALAAAGAAAGYITLSGNTKVFGEVLGTVGSGVNEFTGWIAGLDKQTLGLVAGLGAVVVALSAYESETADAVDQTTGLGKAMALAGGGGLAGLVALYSKFQDVASSVAKLGDEARKARTDVESLQRTQFSTGGSTESVTGALSGIAGKIQEGIQKENEFTKLLDVNNIKWRDGDRILLDNNKALLVASDLIRKAGSEADKAKIAERFGIPKDFVPQLEQGRQAIEANAAQFDRLGLVITASTVDKAKEFDDGWKRSTLLATTYVKSWLAELIPLVDQLISQADKWVGTIQSGKGALPLPDLGGEGLDAVAYQKLGGDVKGFFEILANGVDNKNMERLGEQAKKMWSDLFITYDEARFERAKRQLAELMAAAQKAASDVKTLGLQPGQAVDVPLPRPRPTIVPGEDEDPDKKARAWAREITEISRHIATVNADAAAVGANVGEHERLRVEFKLLDAANRDGIEVTAERSKQLKELAERASGAAMALERAKIASDIKFEGATAFLNPEDVAIAQKLRGIYPDVTIALNSAEAAAMRFNNLLKSINDAAGAFASGLLKDIAEHVKPMEALARAAAQLAAEIAGGDYSPSEKQTTGQPTQSPQKVEHNERREYRLAA